MPNSILRENKELWWIPKLVYRSPGDGQVDFKTIFSKLSQYDFKGWPMECCIKNQEDGAQGAEFIKNNIIKVTDKAFDDFAR
jgi:sugar phosphate isomerase/epimerase